MAQQTPAEAWSMDALLAANARAAKTKDPDQIRPAAQALNAARIEREIRVNLTRPHGVSDEERRRLAELLLGGVTMHAYAPPVGDAGSTGSGDHAA